MDSPHFLVDQPKVKAHRPFFQDQDLDCSGLLEGGGLKIFIGQALLRSCLNLALRICYCPF